MKKTIKNIFLSSFVVLLVVLAFTLTACKKTTTTSFVDQGEVGDYYSSALAEEASLSLDNNAFTLTKSSVTTTGTYTFDGKNLVFMFEGDTTGVNVNFGTNMISFAYKEDSYVFYKNVSFTVSFNTNGGTSVDNQTVRNGQLANEPTSPTKDGYTFVGWYKDSSFNTAFSFDSEIVTSDLTLYAWFQESTNEESEFTVSYVTGVDSVSFENNKWQMLKMPKNQKNQK